MDDADALCTAAGLGDVGFLNEAAFCTAAGLGDVGFLNEALIKYGRDSSYFLCQKEYKGFNILHCAMEKGQDTFISEALQKLQVAISLALICQSSSFWGNPLHVALLHGKMSIVKLLVCSYKNNHDKIISSLSATQVEEGLAGDSCQPPWLAQDASGCTPMHLALEKQQEEIALYLASLDKSLLTMVDKMGQTPIFSAVYNGCERYLEKVLISGLPYSVGDPNKSNPLHVASNCSGRVARLLLERHPELIQGTKDCRKDSVLHGVVESGKVWLVELMLIEDEGTKDNSSRPWVKVCRKLIWGKNNKEDTPLHVAAYNGCTEIGKIIVAAYKSAPQDELLDLARGSMGEQPWLLRNCDGDTPLILALKNHHDGFACYMLTAYDYSMHLVNKSNENPLYQAIIGGCEQAAEKMLKLNSLYFTRDEHGKNFLHVAPRCIEKVAKLLIQELPDLIRGKDRDGKTPLCEAAEAGATWLVKLLLEEDSSLIHYVPSAWIGACKKGHLQTILCFTQHCPDLIKVCQEIKETPLHHVKLQNYKEYEVLLADPVIREFHNEVDSRGATPLHQAIERDDITLAQILLTANGVHRNIKDNNGKTAMDLLKMRCDDSEQWARMCRRINLNPKLKTSYLESNNTNLEDMRGTLSVVAALLATISFAAGFTIPGGFDSSHGDAILGSNSAFEVFLLSNSFTMCCSMVVLFCLIWSMVSDRDKALVLIDRSIYVLQLALCGTIVAFMTGVYATLHKKSQWVSIVIIVMCSIVPISTNQTILYSLIERFIPASSHSLIPQAGQTKLRFKHRCQGSRSSKPSRHGPTPQAGSATKPSSPNLNLKVDIGTKPSSSGLTPSTGVGASIAQKKKHLKFKLCGKPRPSTQSFSHNLTSEVGLSIEPSCHDLTPEASPSTEHSNHGFTPQIGTDSSGHGLTPRTSASTYAAHKGKQLKFKLCGEPRPSTKSSKHNLTSQVGARTNPSNHGLNPQTSPNTESLSHGLTPQTSDGTSTIQKWKKSKFKLHYQASSGTEPSSHDLTPQVAPAIEPSSHSLTPPTTSSISTAPKRKQWKLKLPRQPGPCTKPNFNHGLAAQAGPSTITVQKSHRPSV